MKSVPTAVHSRNPQVQTLLTLNPHSSTPSVSGVSSGLCDATSTPVTLVCEPDLEHASPSLFSKHGMPDMAKPESCRCSRLHDD